MVNNMNDIVMDVKNGKGSLGEFIRDSGMAKNVNEVLFTIKNMGMGIDSISKELYATVKEIKQDISSGSGPATALLKDSLMVNKLHVSLDNIAKGTDGFNQNMEALKHSYFFRGYFKKLANQKKKDSVSLFNEKR